MRSASLKFLAALVFGMAVGAHAQINPGTQIGWPGGCNALNQVYSFYTQGCITVSNAGLTGLPTTGGTMTGPIGFAGGALASPATSTLGALGAVSAVSSSQQNMYGPLNASVNSQVNVMAPPFNAKGDCVTDDSVAIQAALNVQLTRAPQVTVYFPAPPGGCYLTSTLTYTGASLQGQAGAGALTSGSGVVLRGKPSQDVLHIPDPNTPGSVGPRDGWSIRDINFVVDGSVDASASFPHRWPGKWVQDGAINASSNQFTSSRAEFTCGDIGQNILVKGAGSGGANLSTTISAVSPCWHNGGSSSPTATATTVTLAASASTSVTNAYAYITPAGIPVTQTLGNCAIAADNYDGNPADWVMTGNTSNFQPSMWNVTIVTTSGGTARNTCGIYFAGTWVPYMMDAKNVWAYGTEWGIVQGLTDTNPSSGVAGQDYQKWDHGWLENTYPWISYNLGETHLEDIQLTASTGPQILQIQSTGESAPSSWYIHVPEFETSTGVGWRIEGFSATVVGTELCDGGIGTIDTVGSRFINSSCGGTLDLNGENNWLDGSPASQTISNNGMDNIVDASYKGNTSSQMLPTTVMTQTLNRGRQAFGTLTPDFIRNGTSPYYSDHDLFIWPQDFTDISGHLYNVVADANSWTGNYVTLPQGDDFYYWNNMYMLGRTCTSSNTGGNCNQIYAGQNIPAGPVMVEFSYKCPSITSFNATIKAYGTGTTVGGPTATTCSTSYATQTVSADFTGYSGQAFDLNLSAGEVDIAWVAVVPIGNVQATNVTTPLITFAPNVACDWGESIADQLTCTLDADNNSSFALSLPGNGTFLIDAGTITLNSTSGKVNLDGGSHGTTYGSTLAPVLFYSHADTQLSACASGTMGETAWVKDATALTPGTAYSVTAGAGAYRVQVECTFDGTSAYAWQTM